MAGAPATGGGRRAQQKKQQQRKQQRKGPKGVRQQPAQQPQIPQSLDDFQLPPDLQKMFNENKPKF